MKKPLCLQHVLLCFKAWFDLNVYEMVFKPLDASFEWANFYVHIKSKGHMSERDYVVMKC